MEKHKKHDNGTCGRQSQCPSHIAHVNNISSYVCRS